MADLPYILIGGGGHTRVLLGVLRLMGEQVHGILTQDESIVGNSMMDAPVLGTDGKFIIEKGQFQLINGVGNRASRQGSGLEVRAAATARYEALGLRMESVIAPNANIMPEVKIHHGAQIMAGATLQPYAVIGAGSIINTNASIDHDVTIGEHTHVAPGAILCGNVTVGSLTHIGAGAIVIQGITIGHACVIGAGVTVTKNVPNGTVVTQ
ncbi:MAG: NeuD/PglB/VioB family sugar acetyltransferase [Alphaproteobacteria bacterium]|nr:NeuD/PglB/VioB family sugar acetyltransferase [Alphaproteobacteria bacterium]